MYLNAHCSMYTTAGTWKQPGCPPTDEWIKPALIYIYIYTHTMDYCSAIKRNAFESVLMRWMNAEPIIQSEVKSEREKQVSYTNTYMDSGKMVQMNLPAGQQWRWRLEKRYVCGHSKGWVG